MIEIRSAAKKYRISISKLKSTAKKILQKVGRKNAVLNVLLTTDKKIQTINRRYLKHDRPTDVIAFSQEPEYLGDLVISLDTTARQAKKYGNSFNYELAFYLCHGILHLMGHDDSTPRKAKKMEKKQIKILKEIGVRS